jgi:hypothetical protein
MDKIVKKTPLLCPASRDTVSPVKGCTDRRIGQLIAFYEFGALETREHVIFQDHLIECEYCYDQVYSIELFSTVFRDHRTAQRQAKAKGAFTSVGHGGRIQKRRWLLRPLVAVAASLVLAIAIGIVVFVNTHPANNGLKVADGNAPPFDLDSSNSPWKDIAVPKASYIPPKRTIVLRSPDESFNRAMAAYQTNDFTGAAAQLQALSELEPDNAVEVKFYLGVALLLAGQSRDAIAPLRQATQFSAGARSESSHYYLALAYLKCGYQEQALSELDAAVQLKGQLHSDAEELRRRIQSSIR